MRKLLSLDDLYEFCVSQNKSFSFDSNAASGAAIVIQTPGSLSFDSEYDPEDGLLKTHLKSCHIDRNRNGSSIKRSVMEEAAKSIYNRPILGYIHTLENGEVDFGGHEIDVLESGEIEYKEIPVGVIPESGNATLVYDEDEDKTYLEVDGYIFEEYTKAADILREKGESKVSVEIAVLKMSFDAKKKVLNLDEICFRGITILGRNDNGTIIQEGMAGSKISLKDFSEDRNSMFTQAEVVELLKEIKAKLSNFDINFLKTKGGDKLKFEELLAKYQITEADIDFSVEGLSDEELEALFAEKFDEGSDTDNDPAEPDGGNEENTDTGNDDTFTANTNAIICSIIQGENKLAEFQLSMNEICNALYQIVNDTYSEQDNAWYNVTTYKDHVVMEDWFSGKAYRQGYKVDGNDYSLAGDRVEVFKNWLTADEEASLNDMKANYAQLEETVKSYELAVSRSEKEQVLKQEKYDILSDLQEYKDLQKNIDNYDLESFTKELKALHSDYISEHPDAVNFSFANKKPMKVAYGFEFAEKKKPYSSLFE